MGIGLLDWEGSPRWYNEPPLVDFFRNTFGDPEQLAPGGQSFLGLNHDRSNPGIAAWNHDTGNDIFRGVASYNEQAGAGEPTLAT